MKNLILVLCAMICCANGCRTTTRNLHDSLHEISMKGIKLLGSISLLILKKCLIGYFVDLGVMSTVKSRAEYVSIS